VIPVPTDAEGIGTEKLEAIVVRHSPKMLYLIPNFANPTGCVLTLRRRKAVLSLATKYQPIFFASHAFQNCIRLRPPLGRAHRRCNMYIRQVTRSPIVGARQTLNRPKGLRNSGQLAAAVATAADLSA
jgi:hypothetical protein